MHIIGIHLDSPYLHGSLIQKKANGIEIRFLKTALLSENDHVKQLYKELFEASQMFSIDFIYSKNFNGWTVSGLSAKDFLTRQLEIKMASERHLKEVIAFQSEATSYFAPGEMLSAPFIYKRGVKEKEALLFTAQKAAIGEHLDKLTDFGIDPDCVTTNSLAICNFINWKFPSLKEALLIDLGSSETTCSLFKEGNLKKTHHIPIGVEDLLQKFFEDRKKILLKKEAETAAKQLNLLLLKPGLTPHLHGILNELKQEMGKVYYRFCEENDPVIFTGRVDSFIHLREYLIDSYQDSYPLNIEEQKYGVSIGLALEAFKKEPLQLRLGEFFPKKNWARLGRFATFLLSGSLFLATLTAFMGKSLIQSSQKQMGARIGSSTLCLEEKIDEWIHTIEKNNKEYPYILLAPNVTDAISWLSSHPLLEALKNEGDPIDLQQFRYQLVNFPHLGSLKEPYLAKLEIEFNFKNAINARRFHEALRGESVKIDLDKQIKWESMGDGYKATFFLKNRSPHV